MSPPTLQRLARLSLVPGICIALALVAGAYADKDKPADRTDTAPQIARPIKVLTIADTLPAKATAPRSPTLAASDEDPGGDPLAGGADACLTQPNNQANGIFSDPDCDFCGGGQQFIAEQFVVSGVREVDQLTWWGGYFPDNLPLAVDVFTIVFLEDDNGLPGAVINSIGPIEADSRVATGVVLFGVDEYEYNLAFDPNKVLPGPGTFWIEIYNDTSGNTDSWFWETGDLDPANGLPGSAFSVTFPKPPWIPTGGEMAITIDCKPEGPGACCNSDGQGNCTLETEADCTALGGIFLGGGISCNECPPPECGLPNAGPCNVPNGSPGCEDAECCASVCAVLPDCCDVDWDQGCATEAIAQGCANPPACGKGAGSCFEPHGTPGCDNEACCALVCAGDPGCCAVEWTPACVALAFQVCEAPPCKLKSPPGALDEGEDCGIDTNGGCNSDPPVYTNAVCGDVFAGNAWADGGTRDTDWYVVEHGGGILSATLTSQFQGVCFILSGPPADCGAVVLEGSIGCGSDCANVAIASADLVAGTYVVFVATGNCDGSGIFDGVPCGGSNNYVLEIDCKGGPPPCPADFDLSGAVDVKDLLFLLGAWGPCPKQGECPADFDLTGAVDVKDLLFLLGAWGPCPL